MGEAVLLNIARSLLQELSSLAKQEFMLLWTSKHELEKLCNSISTIKAVVEDADQKQATNPAIAVWLTRLREEIYNTDDFFDRISAKSLQRKAMSGNKMVKQVRLFFSKSNNHLVLLVSTAHKVKELRRRLHDIASDINQFGLITSSSHSETHSPRGRREEHSYVQSDDIIGRKNEQNHIVNVLMKADVVGVPISVITIVGIGGLGKTALAQLVFNQKHVQRHFDLCLWACVNNFLYLSAALEKIVACGTNEKCEGLQLEQLQKMLREKIGNKKYLLVLDDVWDADLESWSRLKHLLDSGSNGSRILVTTRLKRIADSLSSVQPLYLQGLSDEDAWSLFKKVAFDPNESDKIEKMEKTGRSIVHKCTANVPLAIRVIGSFLRNKDENKWFNTLNHEISEGHDKIMEVLKVSFNDLALSLKHCFAYCSLFPKDYVFRKDELIHLWMAQGFLHSPDQKRSLEDIGDDCFSSLLERCFFQDVVTRKTKSGDIVSCKMHDLVHDLAVDVAQKECIMVESHMKDVTGAHRHASYNFDGKVLQERLRTLFFHHKRESILAYLNDQQILQLRCLRVLDLSCLGMKELPNCIGKLVHLRYLDLSRNKELIKLPNSFCKLQNLLTLKLKGCCRLQELPADLKLLSLRHLELERCCELSRMPSGLKEMTNLVTLSKFVVHEKSGGLKYLRLLNNLRGDLRIQIPGNGWKDCGGDAEGSMLSSKTKITSLSLQWSRHLEGLEFFEKSDQVLGNLNPPYNLRFLQMKRFPGRRISDCFSSLVHLIDLEISDCTECVELPPLRQLNSLKRLVICNLPRVVYMEKEFCYDMGSFFRSLQSLYISEMLNLKGWWSSAAGTSSVWFTRVSTTSIQHCPNLTYFPFLPYVEQLTIKNVNEKLLRSSLLRVPQTESSASCWRLKSLHILSMDSLVSLPDDWAEPLSNLRTLSIVKCPKLKSLSQHLLKHLASLEALEIQDCKQFCFQEKQISWVLLPKLEHLILGYIRDDLLEGLHSLTVLQRLDIWFDSSDEDSKPVSWMPPPNLKDLRIGNTKKLRHFSESFSQLSKLEVLKFWKCEVDEDELNGIPWEFLKALGMITFSLPKVKALPDGCSNLHALHNLEILDCYELKSLPDWITRLKTLRIARCGRVSEECNNYTGLCSSLIRDIPDVEFW